MTSLCPLAYSARRSNAEVIVLGQSRPLWLLVIAVAVMGERVGWRRPLAAAIGFLGVVVIW